MFSPNSLKPDSDGIIKDRLGPYNAYCLTYSSITFVCGSSRTEICVLNALTVSQFTQCAEREFQLLWSPYGIGQAIIFLPCDFYLLSHSSPNVSGRRLDVYYTSTHGVALVQI